MGPELSTAFTLLLTGMITVFVVLLLVVATGKLLIRLVNAYFPEPVAVAGAKDQVDKRKIAAINAAVEIVTEGRGRVVEIKRKN